MNRHYFNLEQDKEQPRWSWDHFASWGIDLWTFGELNFQSFANLGPRTPRAMGHGPWALGHGPWALGHGPGHRDPTANPPRFLVEMLTFAVPGN